jgi:Cys-tRNA(Pro)/Cys-tRNA(Cys) deacylase
MTPAVLAARKSGIVFTLHEYAHNPAHESYGLEAATALGVAPARVFKTLVARIDGARFVVAIVPVERFLDLRTLAGAVGGKKAAMAEASDAERVTGYVVGGISPLGQKKPLPAVLDESALAFDSIYVSAGRRGLEIELSPHDLMKLSGARAAAIGKTKLS